MSIQERPPPAVERSRGRRVSPDPAGTRQEPSQNDAAAAAATANTRYRWLILVGLVISAILEVMDTSILNVALPQMAGNLGATTTDIAWVSTGYILANVIVLPMTAWLSQRFGRKNYLIGSIAIFTVARLLCAFAPSLGVLVLWRVIQGAAGAALISTAQATLVAIFPARQQGAVQSIFGLGLSATPALAPALGGWIVDNYSWQIIFYIHLPVSIVSLFLIGTMLKDDTSALEKKAAGRIDLLGVVLLAASLGSIQYVLEEGERYDWFGDVWITRFAVVGVATLVMLIAWQLWPTNRNPIVDLRVYRDRGLSASVILSIALGFGLYGINYAFPQFAQAVLGFTATKSGLAVVPQGFGLILGIGLIGALLGKGADPRYLIGGGFSIAAFGTWLLSRSSPATGIEDTFLPLFVLGFGLGALFIPITLAGFAGLKGQDIATGSAQLGLGRQLGGSFGIAILGTYITSMTHFHRAGLVQYVFTGSAALSDRMAGIASGLVAHGYSPSAAKAAALGVVNHAVDAQAMAMAYDNCFVLTALVLAASLPLVFLLKKPRPGAAAPVTH